MAKQKKSRTPPPPKRPAAARSDGKPRQVQAPQVRTKKRRSDADTDRRNRMILYGLGASGIIGLAVVLLVLFVFNSGGGSHGVCSAKDCPDDGPSVALANLADLKETPPPWGPNSNSLPARLKAMKLAPLQTEEGSLLHIHQHLDIFNDGKKVNVPPAIGIRVRGNRAEFAELHTHDADGVIHVESFRNQTVSLGQFFGVWGVNLAKNCVGGLCSPPGPFKIYVNGDLFTGDPIKLVLQAHQEIAIVYGKPPADIPSSYDWPPGE